MGAGLSRRERHGDRQSPRMGQQITHSQQPRGTKQLDQQEDKMPSDQIP
jgi:hypothetical protein